MTSITTILLDADGVVQEASPNWIEGWTTLLNDPSHLDAFVSDIFAAESPHATGKEGLEDSIEQVLRKWQSSATLEEALRVWTLINPNREILQLVDDLRSSGKFVALATNQQHHRLNYMTNTLGYSGAFDALFVSCEIGLAKPSLEYFSYIINSLNRDPGEMLFIDDSEKNVIGARTVGMNAEIFHLSEGRDQLESLLRSYHIEVA